MVQVVGMDWATTRSRRYAVRLAVDAAEGRLELAGVHDKLGQDDVWRICRDETLDSVGVDVAFGWPREFCGFVADWRPGHGRGVDAVSPERFMLRRTDRVVKAAGLGRPLSVSTNLLGRSAQSWTHQFLESDGPARAQIDVLGEPRGAGEGAPRLLEVYPKATLNALLGYPPSREQLGLETYDRRDVDSRVALLCGLEGAVGLTGVRPEEFGSNEHRVDALLAAIATAIYAAACHEQLPLFRGWSVLGPDIDEREDALREGWIFVPIRPAHGD